MLYLVGIIPLFVFLGMGALAFYYWKTETEELKETLDEYYNHPDKDYPLYNRGHCDRYSAGTFAWW